MACIVSVLGCSDDEPIGLVIDVRSDLAPGTEAAFARTVLYDSSGTVEVASRELPLFTGDPLAEGLRIAEIGDLSPGEYVLEATLLDLASEPVVSRQRVLDVRRDRGIVIDMLRTCSDVTCPEEAPLCFEGRCIVPLCVEGASCFDGPIGAESIGRCVAGTQICVDELTPDECVDQQLPQPELVNDSDDDCDDLIDEGTGLFIVQAALAADDRGAVVFLREQHPDTSKPHLYLRRLLPDGTFVPSLPQRLDGVDGRSIALARVRDGWVASLVVATPGDDQSMAKYIWLDQDLEKIDETGLAYDPGGGAAVLGAYIHADRMEALPDGGVARLLPTRPDPTAGPSEMSIFVARPGIDPVVVNLGAVSRFALLSNTLSVDEAGRIFVAFTTGSEVTTLVLDDNLSVVPGSTQTVPVVVRALSSAVTASGFVLLAQPTLGSRIEAYPVSTTGELGVPSTELVPIDDAILLDARVGADGRLRVLTSQTVGGVDRFELRMTDAMTLASGEVLATILGRTSGGQVVLTADRTVAALLTLHDDGFAARAYVTFVGPSPRPMSLAGDRPDHLVSFD